MPKSILPDVDVEILDGGLGLSSGSSPSTHVKIGYCTGAVAGNSFVITKSDQVAEFLGKGPLADACLDSLQMGSQKIIAVAAAASVAGEISEVTHVGTGSATFATSGSPNNDYDIIIQIVKGGALNVAQYQESLDGGDTWSGVKTVPLNGAVAVTGTGVTITFTAGNPAEGSFVAGDTYSFSTSAPAMSNQDFLDAMAVVRNNNWGYEFIHVVGESSASLWAVCAAEADALEADHVPIFFVCEARNINAAETVNAYVQSLVTEAAAFVNKRVKVVAARAEIKGLNSLTRDANLAGLYCGILSKAKVHESPGKVMSFPLTPVVALKPDGITYDQIASLDAARFVTARQYVDMPGFYITNGRTMAADGSDYQYIETLRIANKAAREVRKAMLYYAQSEGDKDGLENLKAAGEAPLDLMMSNKEIAGYKLTIDPNQDILTTSTVEVELAIVPVPIMRWITIKQRMTNPFRR